MKPKKAFIPVAGYGTRRLPITKAIEKSMLPLLNRPIIDYIVQDCIKAGVTEIYFVVSEGSSQLESYYEHNQELEEYLGRRGTPEMIESVQPPEGVTFNYITQEQNNGHYGTTVPVWLCRDMVSPDEAVLVIMGDQCLYREDGGSDVVDMIAAVETQQSDAGMVTVPVPEDQVQYYGIVALDETKHFSHIVDKPKVADAPSNLNNASIYLVPGTFWDFVAKDMERPHESEYMITDVLNDFVVQGHKVAVYEAKGKYLDCGNLEGWVEANNYMLQQTLKGK